MLCRKRKRSGGTLTSRLQCFTFSIFLSAACAGTITVPGQIHVREASGVARLGEKLLIVGDDADGRFFEIEIENPADRIIPIDPSRVREIPLPGAELAMDLESIDLLADGRLALLSEQLHCLIARSIVNENSYEVAAEYDKMYTEFANRGLEGLAVKDEGDGVSRVAVLWEGGYPVMSTMNPQLRDVVGPLPMKPVIIVHRIGRNETVGRVTDPEKYITLEVPEPSGEVPSAQRFRGSDLVWHSWHEEDGSGKPVEGFIVLLSSENLPAAHRKTEKKYEFKVIQRFDLAGRPVGEPLEINEVCSQDLAGYFETTEAGKNRALSEHMEMVREILDKSEWESINWEGLAWYEEGQSLISIYDTFPLDPPFAFILDLPDTWK